MPLDQSFVEQNRASTRRIRELLARISEANLQKPLGEYWTVAITLAHLAFWDRRVLFILDKTEDTGQVAALNLDILLNDILLPFWAAIPPRQAARMAVEIAEQVDQKLEAFSPALLEAIYASNPRLVIRAMHRNEHLDEVDAALAA